MGNAKVSGYDTHVGGSAWIKDNAGVSANLYNKPTFKRGVRLKEVKLGLNFETFYKNELSLVASEIIRDNAVIHNAFDFLTFVHPLNSDYKFTWTRCDNLWRDFIDAITEDEFMSEMKADGIISEKLAEKYVELAHIFAELAPLIDEVNC
mgnify:CR=1 FL=1